MNDIFKQKLIDAEYPLEMIKNWDEDQCEAEWDALRTN